MATQAGHLLLNRRNIELAPGDTTVDTGLEQPNRNFRPDPGMDGDANTPSRIMVVPLMPIPAWLSILHEEPFVDPVTGRVNVVFTNLADNPVTINVLFWNPHTVIGPVSADVYGTNLDCPAPEFIGADSDFQSNT